MSDLAFYLLETTSRLRQALPVTLRQDGVRMSLPALEVVGWTCMCPRTVSELAELQGVSTATMSATLSRLAKQGLVSRHRALDDRRRVIIEPTVKGRTVTEGVRKRIYAMLDEVVAGLSDGEKELLMAGLRSLLSALERDRKPNR